MMTSGGGNVQEPHYTCLHLANVARTACTACTAQPDARLARTSPLTLPPRLRVHSRALSRHLAAPSPCRPLPTPSPQSTRDTASRIRTTTAPDRRRPDPRPCAPARLRKRDYECRGSLAAPSTRLGRRHERLHEWRPRRRRRRMEKQRGKRPSRRWRSLSAHCGDRGLRRRDSRVAQTPLGRPHASAALHAAGANVAQIKHLLDQGKAHFRSAKAMLGDRSPVAGAYWEYLVAYQIIVDLVPRHPDYYEKLENSRSQTHRDFKDLLKNIKSSEERFVRIKDIIKNDNKRNGGLHKSASSLSSIRPDSRNGSIPRRDDELMLPDVPTSAPNTSPDAMRRKPLVQPKPQSLHGRAVHSSVSSVNGVTDLAARFANLRGAMPPVDTTSTRSSQDLSVKMPSPADFSSTSRPSGPRDMPPLQIPPPPPKLPLNTQLASSLPKEPSPTYSPARNISGPLSINPPRSTPRSMVGTGGRSSSLAASSASSASSHAPNANGLADSYFPVQHGVRDPSSRKMSVSKSVELDIDASKLYDYFRMYNVLLIDVRDRAEFDAGHVYVRNIICIEPLSLRDGDSADQLLDRLIVSPDEEQAMFDRRNEYDVVVYYDESTKNVDFLHNHNRTDAELALKRLFDTLHEFNADKPLGRPPVFLKGGLDAWVDLVGPHALRTSTTAGLTSGGPTRARAIRRSPAASHVAKNNLQNRRRREYVAMDVEEERKWLEEARKGRAAVDVPAGDGEDEEEPVTPFYHSTEEFLRRYPDVESEQSMVLPSARFQSTNQYVAPAIPVAPSRPPPSVPRVSYSGVHERQITQQGRGQQPPVYLSQPRFSNVRMHRTGLLNFGVTCYMNSVVQCLSGHLLLSDLFLSQRYQRDLQTDNWKGTKGILPEAYATLLSNLFKGDVSSVRPSTFRVSWRYVFFALVANSV